MQKHYHPDDNELFYRTAELGKIPADEYVVTHAHEVIRGHTVKLRQLHDAERTYVLEVASLICAKSGP